MGMQGDLHDHGSLVSAIKQADVVISTVGPLQFEDQLKIIAAIKEAGNVKVCIFKLLELCSLKPFYLKFHSFFFFFFFLNDF